MVNAFVETSIFVDLLRSHAPAVTRYTAQTSATLAVNPIIWMEIIGGGQNKAERLRAAGLLKQFIMVYLQPEDFNWAMQMHLQ